MPRTLPRRHLHEPPVTQALEVRGDEPQQLPTIPQQQDISSDVARQQNDRISAIERQLRELAKQVKELASRESVVVQDMSLDDATHKRLDAFHRRLDEFQNEIDRLSRATLSAGDADSVISGIDEKVKRLVDAGLSSVRDEVQRVKIQLSSHKRAEGTDVAEQLDILGNMVLETSNLVVQLNSQGAGLQDQIDGYGRQLQATRDELFGAISETLITTAQTISGNKAA